MPPFASICCFLDKLADLVLDGAPLVQGRAAKSMPSVYRSDAGLDKRKICMRRGTTCNPFPS